MYGELAANPTLSSVSRYWSNCPYPRTCAFSSLFLEHIFRPVRSCVKPFICEQYTRATSDLNVVPVFRGPRDSCSLNLEALNRDSRWAHLIGLEFIPPTRSLFRLSFIQCSKQRNNQTSRLKSLGGQWKVFKGPLRLISGTSENLRILGHQFLTQLVFF